MLLSPKTYAAINNTQCRLKIALALGISEQAVIKAIKAKRDTLTKAAALKVIKEETALPENEIFEDNEE